MTGLSDRFFNSADVGFVDGNGIDFREFFLQAFRANAV
jgi:hypothetical protein